MIGLECPSPGTARLHKTFCGLFTSQTVAMTLPFAMPKPSGPRNDGQFVVCPWEDHAAMDRTNNAKRGRDMNRNQRRLRGGGCQCLARQVAILEWLERGKIHVTGKRFPHLILRIR